jgi:hypothetical protein
MATVTRDVLAQWWEAREELAPPCELWRIPCDLATGRKALVWCERTRGALTYHALAWQHQQMPPVHVTGGTPLAQPGGALDALAAAL